MQAHQGLGSGKKRHALDHVPPLAPMILVVVVL
jgi:hypothetical protein